jgi:hypothetical protein
LAVVDLAGVENLDSDVLDVLADIRKAPTLPPVPWDADWFRKDEVAELVGVKPLSLQLMMLRCGVTGEGNGMARRYSRHVVEVLRTKYGQGISVSTTDHYLTNLKNFTRWLAGYRTGKVRHRAPGENNRRISGITESERVAPTSSLGCRSPAVVEAVLSGRCRLTDLSQTVGQLPTAISGSDDVTHHPKVFGLSGQAPLQHFAEAEDHGEKVVQFMCHVPDHAHRVAQFLSTEKLFPEPISLSFGATPAHQFIGQLGPQTGVLRDAAHSRVVNCPKLSDRVANIIGHGR